MSETAARSRNVGMSRGETFRRVIKRTRVQRLGHIPSVTAAGIIRLADRHDLVEFLKEVRSDHPQCNRAVCRRGGWPRTNALGNGS